jgi:hypothetical protein
VLGSRTVCLYLGLAATHQHLDVGIMYDHAFVGGESDSPFRMTISGLGRRRITLLRLVVILVVSSAFFGVRTIERSQTTERTAELFRCFATASLAEGIGPGPDQIVLAYQSVIAACRERIDSRYESSRRALIGLTGFFVLGLTTGASITTWRWIKQGHQTDAASAAVSVRSTR